jgi:8-oxo-dGTP pyrophosphatase MutT (NUDIX family)
VNKDSTRDSGLDVLIQKMKASLLANPGKTVPANSKDSVLPKAAVAVILHPENKSGELLVLFVKRRTREGDPWSGHMAFPGGRYSETDRNLLGTVIREVREEIGVDLRELASLGGLDEVIAGGLPIRVTPYVLLSKDELEIKIDEKEIENCIWIPLSFFQDRKNIQLYKINRLGQTLEVQSYKFLGNQVIWGITFRIIEDFLRKISS